MREPEKLKAFQLADRLALDIYRATKGFPKSEQYGLVAQMRRAAVSTASNIVEGCARNGEADYLRFLDMAYGSVCELQYQVSLAVRLELLSASEGQALTSGCRQTAKFLNALICALRRSTASA